VVLYKTQGGLSARDKPKPVGYKNIFYDYSFSSMFGRMTEVQRPPLYELAMTSSATCEESRGEFHPPKDHNFLPGSGRQASKSVAIAIRKWQQLSLVTNPSHSSQKGKRNALG
jgi:hypothetical protein